MKSRTFFFALIVLFATFIAASCKTAEFGFTTIDIHGMVYDFSNRPVAQCEISLGKRHNTVTDINGRFTLPKVPIGTYVLTAFKNGFESFSDEITVRDRGQIIYVRMPSQNQLLDLIDDALTASNLVLAAELMERAHKIDKNNIEMLFYYATIKFRQNEQQEAIGFLEAAKNLGSKDLFVDRFLSIFGRQQNAKATN